MLDKNQHFEKIRAILNFFYELFIKSLIWIYCPEIREKSGAYFKLFLFGSRNSDMWKVLEKIDKQYFALSEIKISVVKHLKCRFERNCLFSEKKKN